MDSRLGRKWLNTRKEFAAAIARGRVSQLNYSPCATGSASARSMVYTFVEPREIK